MLKLKAVVGQVTVNPAFGVLPEMAIAPAKLMVVRVTFAETPVWPTLRSEPATEILKSPTRTMTNV